MNFTSIKSFALIGLNETGQYMIGSGLSTLDFLADGACDGTQKLGNSFCRPFAILEMLAVLVLGPALVLGVAKKKRSNYR